MNVVQSQRALVGLGTLSGKKPIYKYGGQVNIGTSEQIIWDGGGLKTAYAGFLTAASTLDISSDNAADTGAGANAQKVVLYGLDANWQEVFEEVTLNGASKVTTTAQFMRCWRAWVSEGGSEFVANAGTLTIEKTGEPATILAQISPEKGQTNMCIYTIPAGYYGLVWNADANVGEDKTAIVNLWFREDAAVATNVFRNAATRYLNGNSFTRDYTFPRKFDERTDIMMTALAGQASTSVSASFEIELIKK